MSPSTAADIRTTTPSDEQTNININNNKRIKTEESNSVKDKFFPGLFDQESRDAIRKSVQTSQPYPHCKISKLINDDLLRRVQKEIYANLNFTTKETDIYKVNQTGDLANMDGLNEEERNKLSALFELRNAIYSKEFREFVSEVTGCGLLSPTKMDMSVNTYTEGCHLLNHDDVIGTRRISFILYMPGDPDDDQHYWDPKFGGALELYPVVERDTPANEPTVSVPPQWNQFAMFTVLPGYSFHSVEEVVVQGKPRLSIQGWFHFPQQGEIGYKKDAEKSSTSQSSLQQIVQGAAVDTKENFEQYKNDDDLLDESAATTLLGLTKEDLVTLAAWVNPVYLNAEYLAQVTDKFVDESAVQLKQFLKDDLYAKIKDATLKADEQDHFTESVMPPHGTGVRGDWAVQGSPVSQRFLKLSDNATSDDEETSVLFAQLRANFRSEAFRHWLAVLSQLLPTGYRGTARRFRPGHDFTLATTNSRGQAILDVTLCLANNEKKEEDVEKWESCEYGGYECYMAAHEGDDDPATYRSFDDDGALLTIPAGANELSIVLKDEGVMRFVKYVSARSPGARWDVAFEYDLPEEEEEEATTTTTTTA